MMKSVLAAFVMIAIFSSFKPSEGPVQWTFKATKVADKTYDVTFTATVSDPWHIYSQSTPEGGPVPTKFKFTKNPLIVFEGKVGEKGSVVKKHEDVFDIDVVYFHGNATFTQRVKVKGNAKTNVAGTIEFMACNDEQCLPPAKQSFSIALK